MFDRDLPVRHCPVEKSVEGVVVGAIKERAFHEEHDVPLTWTSGSSTVKL